ncbi:MAG: hypothetical protein M1820_010928 [Bogoriella megaspora]|nr:MAG: hypothetical protein M1820_010928 [Bogoriella megaspora]
MAGATNCSAVRDYAGMTAEKFAGMIPPCAVYCDYKTLAGDGCAIDDFVCHCTQKTQIIADIIVPCLANSTCTGIDIGAFAATVDDTCAYYNSTTNGTCPEQPVQPTTLTGAAAVAATEVHTSVQGTAASTPIPPNYTPTATQQLLMSFQTGTYQVQPGEELGIDVPAAAGHPQIGLRNLPESDQIVETPPADSTYTFPIEVFGPQLYTVVMVDPDAQYPSNSNVAEYLHWLQPNMRLINASTLPPYAIGPFPFIFNANETSTPARLNYSSPMPPTNSAPHRYIVYAFQQPLNFTFPPAYLGFGPSNRSNFDVLAFSKAANLGEPFAANYFYVANGTNGVTANATTLSYSTTVAYSTINSAEATASATGYSASLSSVFSSLTTSAPTFLTGYPHGPPAHGPRSGGFVGMEKAWSAWKGKGGKSFRGLPR